MRGRTFPVTSHELTADQAAPLVRDLLASLSPIVRPVIGSYFGTDLSAPIGHGRRKPETTPYSS